MLKRIILELNSSIFIEPNFYILNFDVQCRHVTNEMWSIFEIFGSFCIRKQKLDWLSDGREDG